MDDFEIDMSEPKKHRLPKIAGFAALCIAIIVCIAVIIKYSPHSSGAQPDDPSSLLLKTDFEVTSDTTLPQLYDYVVDSVVTIKSSFIASSLWNTATVISSGVIVTQAGHIVTNHNVVNGASDITVTLNNRNSYPAKVVTSNEAFDIAIIKINADEDLHVACIGDSSSLNVGDAVFSVGTPYAEELFGSLSTGYVSYVPRVFGDSNAKYVQVNMTYSMNSSSGPLFNMNGEVVGINTIKNVSSSVNNMSFSIASETFKPIVEAGINTPVSTKLGIGISGISVADTNYSIFLGNNGFIIKSVIPDGPAAKAGLKPYDIIIKIDGNDHVSSNTLASVIDQHKLGDVIEILVLRNSLDNELLFEVTLENIEYYE